MKHTLEIRHSSRSRAIAPRALERLARRVVSRVLAGERIPAAEAGVWFVDAPVIRALNHKYRGVDSPTDVMAFGLSDRRERRKPGALLGDVVIAVPVARHQARDLGHPLEVEIALLLIHGVLHLLDYDHATPRDARRMKTRERRYLRACGYDRFRQTRRIGQRNSASKESPTAMGPRRPSDRSTRAIRPFQRD